MDQGTLFVVATPIGNRDDFSPRARQVLLDADLIAAEDTRHTGRLLFSFGIKTPQIALHDHNEDIATEKIILQLKNGKSVALVSDAGTPLISDPGYRLLRLAHAENIVVSPIPGPSSLVAALSIAGIPTDRFCFEGFLPARKVARQERMNQLASETRTCVLFVSVHRIEETVAELIESHGAERSVFLGRELTKLHEQCVATNLLSLRERLASGEITKKGEFVLVIQGNDDVRQEEISLSSGDILDVLADALSHKQAVAIAAQLTGIGRNELYQQLLDRKQSEVQ